MLLPLWVYGLFILVNLAQYVWMLAAASYLSVPFGKIAGGSVKSPAVELTRGLLGPAVGIPFLIVALCFLAPRGFGRARLRFAARPLALGAGLGSAAVLAIMGILGAGGVAAVSGWPGRLPLPALAALVGGKALWSFFKSAVEDILFVGVLAGLWADARGWPAAAWRAGLFFGAIHLLNILPALTASSALIVVLAGSTFGALLVLLAARYRSLWAAIGFHGAWNLWLGTVLGATLSGHKGLGGLFLTELNGPAWLTGGLFGVETSFLSVLVTGALLAWCLRSRTIAPQALASPPAPASVSFPRPPS